MREGQNITRRIALVLEFDGVKYHGWQIQDRGITVQGCLEKALFSIDGRQIRTVAAGRTDAGVHAEALLVHANVDTERWNRSPRAYMHGINQHLPGTIRVVGVRPVPDDFNARFDCLGREYRYLIWNRQTASALHAWRHWWMPRSLSVDHMNESAALLIGEHDFASFQASGCQSRSSRRNIRSLSIMQSGYCVAIDVHADAFLYHMVRNIVGALIRVGTGDWGPGEIRSLLEARDRSLGAATAPSHGLYFKDAIYANFRATEIVGCCDN